MKNYLKSLGFAFGLIIVLTLFITLLNYIGIVSGIFLSILKIIIPVISLFIGGLIIGKNSTQRGWLNGLKIGLIVVVVLIIITLILKEKIDIKGIIYYLVLVSSSVFGSMIGISKNAKE